MVQAALCLKYLSTFQRIKLFPLAGNDDKIGCNKSYYKGVVIKVYPSGRKSQGRFSIKTNKNRVVKLGTTLLGIKTE